MKNLKSDKYDSMEFLANLSHDMKTPIKAQLRAMNLLYSGVFGEFSDEAKNIILNVIASNKFLQRLTDNVLGDFRLNKGEFVLRKSKNDIRKTIEEVICYIGILSEVKGQKISLNYSLHNFSYYYDEVELQRVIINILSNAFEYSKENTEIKIEVSNIKNSLEVLVKNKVFLLYKRKRTFDEMNCNLGLSVSNRIIEAHNGTFEAFIDEDDNYCVKFSVP